MGWNDVEAKVGGEQKDKNEYTKFPEGTTQIRVLDNEPHSFWNHWLPSHNHGVVCPGKGCPICSVIASAKANKEPQKYSSARRHSVRIWNYNTQRQEILVQGQNFFIDLQALHKDIGDITTYDIKVKRTGTGVNDTKYTLMPMAPKPFDASTDIVDVDLKEVFKATDNDKILQLLEGKTWEEVFGKSEEEVAE